MGALAQMWKVAEFLACWCEFGTKQDDRNDLGDEWVLINGNGTWKGAPGVPSCSAPEGTLPTPQVEVDV
jgi:hypothetical protein